MHQYDKESCQKCIDNFPCHIYNSGVRKCAAKKAVRCVKSTSGYGGFMPLYNHLKEYRAKINVNQHEMGQLVGVSRQTISQIERGDYSPSVTLALKIAKVFEVPVEAIFTYEEEPEEEK